MSQRLPITMVGKYSLLTMNISNIRVSYHCDGNSVETVKAFLMSAVCHISEPH